MLSKKIMKYVSLTMFVVMLLSLIPVQICAGELVSSEASESEGIEGNDCLQKIQNAIDTVLLKYLKSTTLSNVDIERVVNEMEWETYQSARYEISELETLDELGELSEEEQRYLIDSNSVFYSFSDALENRNSNENNVSLYAQTVTVLDGKISVTDSVGNGAVSNGAVTITAKGGLLSQTTNTVTITNETENKVQVSFDYNASNYRSFSESSSSGSYKEILEAGGTVTLSITGKRALSSNTATLKLSNFSLTVVAASSNVTVKYDSDLGSVTAGGNTIAPDDVVSNVTLETGIALVATPNSGVTFQGWIDAEGKIISTAVTYTLTPASDMTIKAVFIGAGSQPWFAVGGATQQSESVGFLGKRYYYTVSTSYLFDSLNRACEFAKENASNKCVVAVNDGTLAAGDYIIPTGVTLLIPYDDECHLFTTEARSYTLADKEKYTIPEAYRTLELADGANLIINGSVSLSAEHQTTQGGKLNGGSPINSASFINMAKNSSITVNNGGALYVYGYITGNGNVYAKSGSTIYENFQIMDFRGGTQSTDMDNDVFPLSQYYVQNIEVPITYEAGAMEYAYCSVAMSSYTFASGVEFLSSSSGSMFQLEKGSITKSYDTKRDRLIIELDDDVNVTINAVKLTVGTTSIDSKNYDLPINSNITIYVNGGTFSTNQDLCILPGVEIFVDEDATLLVKQDKNVYIYDQDDWGNFCSPSNQPLIPVTYAPGRTYTRTEADLADAKIIVNGTIDASAGYIYTTAGGANICSDGGGVVKAQAGTQTVTHQLVQGTGYTEIPITPAKLKNSDGSYVTSQTDTYIYTDGFWRCTNHNFVDYKCTICGLEASIKQKGRNLNYDDMISVIDIFEVVGLGDMELTEENSGLLIWAEEDFDANTISVTDENAINKRGLDAYPGTDYIYGESDGIWTRNLHEDAYYVGYVKLTNSDGSTKYIYSEPKLYSPSIYADNMLAKEDTDQKTKDLCVALLNYISAAQMYFYPETTVDQLVNADLSDDQKNIAPEWGAVLSDIGGNLTLAPTVDNPVAKDENVFAATGKNLLFEEMISLGAVYKIEDSIVNNASEHGTIFWTPEQYDAVIANGQVPSLENAGNGEKIDLTQYREQSGQWVSNAPKIAPKDMSDTVYYFMGYVKHTDGSVSYSGVSAYTVEQYIYNKATAKLTTQKEIYMAEFAKCLYFYERAAKAALLSE